MIESIEESVTSIEALLVEEAPAHVIALLTVEMASRDGRLSPDMRKGMANVTRTVLQQCLRPDKDVLLPNMDSGSVRDFFFIVAYTQQHGAEIISERIRRQFRHCEQLQLADLMFAVSHSLLTPMSREIIESMETFAEHMASDIQDRINTIFLERSA